MWKNLKAIASGINRIANQIGNISTSINFYGRSISGFLEMIAKELAAQNKKIGPETSIRLEIGGTMNAKAGAPVLIIDTASKRLFAVGKDAEGALGAQLADGASVAGVTSDATIATLVPDSPPLPDPDGNPSVYSAVITEAIPPKTNVPVDLTVTVTNADTTTQIPVTQTVQFTAGPEQELVLEVL